MEKNKEVKDEKLKGVAGGARLALPNEVILAPIEGGDDDQKFINIDELRRG